MSMQITEKERELDKLAETAMEAARLFREKHRSYFDVRGQTHPETGELLVPYDRALDTEYSRLHCISSDANKTALDAEYEAKRAVKQCVQQGQDPGTNAIVEYLALRGWEVDRIIKNTASKIYAPNAATIRVTPDRDNQLYAVRGEYRSAGEDVLATHVAYIKMSAAPAEVTDRLRSYLEKAEALISQSFAVKFLGTPGNPSGSGWTAELVASQIRDCGALLEPFNSAYMKISLRRPVPDAPPEDTLNRFFYEGGPEFNSPSLVPIEIAKAALASIENAPSDVPAQKCGARPRP